MSKNDGGPAFPVAVWSDKRLKFIDDGMSLRDYFAAKAMQGMLSASHMLVGQDHSLIDKFMSGIGVSSYGIADAMLAERTKGE